MTLRNLGPRTRPQLQEVGIASREKLAALGTEEAFRRLYFRFAGEFKFSTNYLYALEGAILDCDWRAVPPARRQELKAFLQELKTASTP